MAPAARLRVGRSQLAALSMASAVSFAAACAPSDPDSQPVGLQRDGEHFVAVVPTCAGERIQRVEVERVEKPTVTVVVPTLRKTPNTVTFDAPSNVPRGSQIVSVVTSKVIRVSNFGSEKPLPDVASGRVVVDGTLVSLDGWLRTRTC